MIGSHKTVKALILAAFLIFAAGGDARAQDNQAAAAVEGGFDAYRAMAVTAGIIGGAVVATIVTDGLIIPVYAWATGAEMGGMGAAAGMAGGAQGIRAGGAAAMHATGGAVRTMGRHGYELFSGGMRLLGAVSGGFFADSLYTGR